MELKVRDALQQAVSAHTAGKLKDVERLYRLILKAQATHPDANHNPGLLAMSCNKIDLAAAFVERLLRLILTFHKSG